MRDAFYKVLPAAAGVLLGYLLLNPPAWLAALGPLAWLVNGLLCAVLLVASVGLVIIANLPDDPALDPVGEDEVHPELRALAERIERLGFRRAGPPCRVNISPSGILVGFVHGSRPVYSTVFRTGNVEAKTSFDFVSILHGDRGALTTNADPGGAALPAGPGELRQVLAGQEIEVLFEKHLEGLAYLERHGVHCRAVSADMLQQDFRAAMRKTRKRFLAAPLRSTLVTLWRAATRRVPFSGTLREQQVAQREIARLAAG